jgi:hypothetical protein
VSTEADVGASDQSALVLGYVLVDARGVIVASGAHRAEAGRHAFTTRVPRGNYSLRVGGIDHLGRRGMVERRFAAVVQQRENVQVSDLILAPAPPDDNVPLLPIVDTVDARRVVAYLELAAIGERRLADLEVRVTITNDTAAATDIDARAALTSSGARWARARAELALEGLTAGRYVAVAQVLAGGDEIARVSRPFSVR